MMYAMTTACEQCITAALKAQSTRASVAQLVEQCFRKAEVVGSNPTAGFETQ